MTLAQSLYSRRQWWFFLFFYSRSSLSFPVSLSRSRSLWSVCARALLERALRFATATAAAFTSFRFPIARCSCVLGRMYTLVLYGVRVFYKYIYVFFFYSQCTPFARRHAHSPATLPCCALVPRSRYIMTLWLPEWQPWREGKSYCGGPRRRAGKFSPFFFLFFYSVPYFFFIKMNIYIYILY